MSSQDIINTIMNDPQIKELLSGLSENEDVNAAEDLNESNNQYESKWYQSNDYKDYHHDCHHDHHHDKCHKEKCCDDCCKECETLVTIICILLRNFCKRKHH